MSRPSRASALEAVLSENVILPDQPIDAIWNTLIQRINNHNVVPIISNSVRNDRIFDIAKDSEKNADQIISEAWAKRIHYPLADRHHLARVANYNRVKRAKDEEQAKGNYLTFLKEALLMWYASDLAEGENSEPTDLSRSLRDRIHQLRFSDLAEELEYPRFTQGEDDLLETLAKLPIKIYITTSYYDFLERTLIAKNRPPRTQICFWSGVPANVSDEHRTDHGLKPSIDNPLVFHMHGFEDYPRTMVLSEDDYLDFLVRISQDSNTKDPLIPLYLRDVLASEALMLLGYRLHDWDFRSLFRGVVNARHSQLRLASLVLQFDPDDLADIVDPVEAKDYLTKYFEPSRFQVIWQDVYSFMQELWSRYDQGRQA